MDGLESTRNSRSGRAATRTAPAASRDPQSRARTREMLRIAYDPQHISERLSLFVGQRLAEPLRRWAADEASIASRNRGRDRDHSKRQLIRGFVLALSVAIPIGFERAGHLPQTTN